MMLAAARVTLLVAALMTFAVMVAAFVALAMMVTAVVTFPVVVMVIAACVGIVGKISPGKGLCRFVSGALHTAVELDPGIGKGHLCAHSDPTADQSVHFRRLQEASQSAVAAAVGINDLFFDDFPVFNVIQFEVFGMAEMLEDFSIFKSEIGRAHV